MNTPEHIKALAAKVLSTANELRALGRQIPPDAIDYEWEDIDVRWNSECQELITALREVYPPGYFSVFIADSILTCKTAIDPGDTLRPAWERISFSRLV